MDLQFATGDPHDILKLPHPMFSRGDRRRIDVTLHGPWEGGEVALCDYTYTEIRHNAQGQPDQTDYTMALVVVALDESLPSIEIFPEGVGRQILNAVGLGKDIRFESEEFNKAFTVLSANRDFAFALIDQPMMGWLMNEARNITIELEGRHVLFAVHSMSWDRMTDLTSRAVDFGGRFSPLVWEMYGHRQ